MTIILKPVRDNVLVYNRAVSVRDDRIDREIAVVGWYETAEEAMREAKADYPDGVELEDDDSGHEVSR